MSDLIDTAEYARLMAESIVTLAKGHTDHCNNHKFPSDCPIYITWAKNFMSKEEVSQKGPLWWNE